MCGRRMGFRVTENEANAYIQNEAIDDRLIISSKKAKTHVNLIIE